MDNKAFDEAVLNHFNQIVNNYEIVEYREEDVFDYLYSHKQTGESYIRLQYSEIESMIEVRLLSLKAVCLVKRSSGQTLSDFIHLSAKDLIDRIAYIDIPGDPAFYYSSNLSNKDLSIYKIANNKSLQVKLIALIAEVQLALQFAGIVHLNNN